MSSLKESEPHLILHSDKTVTKISEYDELESLRYQLKILKEKLGTRNVNAPDEKLMAQVLEENARYKLRIEKLHPLLIEKESVIVNLQQLVEKFRESAGFLRGQLQKLQMKELVLDKAASSHQTEASSLQAQIQKDELEIDQLKSELSKEKLSNRNAHEEISALYTQFELLKKRVVESEHVIPLLHEREKKVHELEQSTLQAEKLLQAHAIDMAELRDKLSKMDAVRKEMEEQLKYAHLHLAKKVRETTELTDLVKTREKQVEDAVAEAVQAKAKMEGLQQHIARYQNQEQIHEKQIKEAEHSAHIVALEAEEKYCKVYDALKKNEAQLNEFKLIEEKYQQLQSILNNINGCFEVALPQKEKQQPRPYQNLFDMHASALYTPPHLQ